jgi:hypothetical protein
MHCRTRSGNGRCRMVEAVPGRAGPLRAWRRWWAIGQGGSVRHWQAARSVSAGWRPSSPSSRRNRFFPRRAPSGREIRGWQWMTFSRPATFPGRGPAPGTPTGRGPKRCADTWMRRPLGDLRGAGGLRAGRGVVPAAAGRRGPRSAAARAGPAPARTGSRPARGRDFGPRPRGGYGRIDAKAAVVRARSLRPAP